MVENDELQRPIGDEEAKTQLMPARVTINSIKIEEVGAKKAKKVVLGCIHPNAEDLINISSAKIESKGKLDVVGLWFNKDSKGNIQKGSTVAKVMQLLGAPTLGDLKNKTCETIADDKGYLCLKAY